MFSDPKYVVHDHAHDGPFGDEIKTATTNLSMTNMSHTGSEISLIDASKYPLLMTLSWNNMDLCLIWERVCRKQLKKLCKMTEEMLKKCLLVF